MTKLSPPCQNLGSGLEGTFVLTVRSVPVFKLVVFITKWRQFFFFFFVVVGY